METELLGILTLLCILCTGVSFWCLRQMTHMSGVLQELIATYAEASRADLCSYNHTHHASTRCQEKASYKAFILHEGGAMIPHRVCQAHAQMITSAPPQRGVAYVERLNEETDDEQGDTTEGHPSKS